MKVKIKLNTAIYVKIFRLVVTEKLYSTPMSRIY